MEVGSKRADLRPPRPHPCELPRSRATPVGRLTTNPTVRMTRAGDPRWSLVILRNGVVIQTVLPMKSTVAPPASRRGATAQAADSLSYPRAPS